MYQHTCLAAAGTGGDNNIFRLIIIDDFELNIR